MHPVHDIARQTVLYHLEGDGAPGGLRDGSPAELSNQHKPTNTSPATDPIPASKASVLAILS